jgi:GTPase SAR1 family protein
MIIVEGPDGAGKTTLVEKILEMWPVRTALGERGTTDRNKLYTVTVEDTYRALRQAVNGRREAPAFVWDRLFFSDMVYAPMMKRECAFNMAQQAFIIRLLEAMGCPIILCLPPFEVIQENAQVHEQMKGVNENLNTIVSNYRVQYFTMPNQTIIYDYTGQEEDSVDINQVYKTIDAYLNLRAGREW